MTPTATSAAALEISPLPVENYVTTDAMWELADGILPIAAAPTKDVVVSEHIEHEYIREVSADISAGTSTRNEVGNSGSSKERSERPSSISSESKLSTATTHLSK
jgi:hypothetical protein